MNIHFKQSLLVLALAVVFPLLWSHCSTNENQVIREVEAAVEKETHEEVVHLPPEELKEFGIELATAGAGKLETHIDLTGEIVINPDRLAHIIPRFPGIVKAVRKRIGDDVKKGEVLAVIESNESLAPYNVVSLIDGTVIEMHLTRGELVSDATHAFVVADLSHVWADLNVYQKDLTRVRIGQKAIISASPAPVEATGRISYISPVVDESTRTAIARVVLPNPKRQWRPGMFVTARVIVGNFTARVVVPKTALQRLGENTVVFVKTDEGFQPRTVHIGRANTRAVEILSGLNPGETYVSKGGFTLKSELLKESFGEGDEH